MGLFGGKKEYDTHSDRIPDVYYIDEFDIQFNFEILNFLKNGNIFSDDVKEISLQSNVKFFYFLNVILKNKKYLHKFGNFEGDIQKKEIPFSLSKIENFRFESATGILFIDDENNDHYEIHLKFKSEIKILHNFLSFIYARENKINDKTIQEISLNNFSEKVMLEKNKTKLHKNEEVLSTFIFNHREDWNKYEKAIKFTQTWVITNFRIMQDIWYYPAFFKSNSNSLDDITKIISNKIFNFTHDEYEDIFASNIVETKSSNSVSTGGTDFLSVYGIGINQEVHNFQGMSSSHESGDIVFMSKGKIFHTWTDFKDPKGIVEMIKSAKKQFVLLDKKTSESNTSLLDDDPFKILKLRLAKGEITKEEYEDLKSILE